MRGRDPAAAPLAPLLGSLGVGFMLTLVSQYFVKHCTDVLLVRPALAGALVTAARLGDALWAPLVGHLSDRTRGPWARRRGWMLASAAALAAAFVPLRAGRPAPTFPLVALLGATAGAAPVLVPAMQAALVDDEERRTGRSLRGAYFAAFGVYEKAAAAAPALLLSFALERGGFRPNEAQSDAARLALATLFCGPPGLAALLAAFTLHPGASRAPASRQ